MRIQTLQTWFQRRSPVWAVGVGAIVGLGIGASAVLALKGAPGLAVCLFVLGFIVWWAKDAEPVFVQPEVELQPPATTTEREAESEPQIVEPLDMVPLSGGTFLMGSPDSDQDALDGEKPQHEVTVSDFLIGRFPVTHQLYRQILDQSLPEWDQDAEDGQLPANYVTWFQAVVFCNALSEHVGLSPCYRIDGKQVEWDHDALGYRLPTEAEWEYACRAGSTSKWFFGDNPEELGRYAWFTRNSGVKVQPVGKKEPNLWGLHDMIGNVREWCWDWYADYSLLPTKPLSAPIDPGNGRFRVQRGGSAWHYPRWLRSACRSWGGPEDLEVSVFGFRCVRRPRRQH